MRQWTYYSGGRIFAVATRPLCIFLANNFLPGGSAQDVAIAFLASTLALVVTAADSHRRFYLHHFDPDRPVGGMVFYVFVVSIILLMLLGGVAAFGTVLHFTASISLAMAAAVYFLSEKFADEVLRFKLFERAFDSWGLANIKRSVLQLLSVGALFWFIGPNIPPWLAIVALAAANGAVFFADLPQGALRLLRPRRRRITGGLARRALGSIRENWILWVLAIATAMVGYTDRLFALILDKEILPLFMLVVMSFSLVQLLVDFVYVSRYRRDFLEQRISIRRALASKGFFVSLGSGLFLGGVACAAVLFFSRNGSGFPLEYVLIIAALQTFFAVTMVPQQILYWQHRIERLFGIEVVFWVFLLAFMLTGWKFGFSSPAMLGLLALCVLMRMTIYITVALRSVSMNVIAAKCGASDIEETINERH